ncbi:MAG: hypothetical protein ACLU5E_10465 [Anaerovoracaceae bacterium]
MKKSPHTLRVDEILPVCSHILTSGGIREMDAKDRLRINKLCESMSENALRVLAFYAIHRLYPMMTIQILKIQ